MKEVQTSITFTRTSKVHSPLNRNLNYNERFALFFYSVPEKKKFGPCMSNKVVLNWMSHERVSLFRMQDEYFENVAYWAIETGVFWSERHWLDSLPVNWSGSQAHRFRGLEIPSEKKPSRRTHGTNTVTVCYTTFQPGDRATHDVRIGLSPIQHFWAAHPHTTYE